MLAILFLILKIIGGILLAAVLLLLLLILLVLFCPIRYRAEGECEKSADTLQASLTFSWLFHLISGKASWQDKELTYRVRILTKKTGSSPPPGDKEKKTGSSPKKAGGDAAGKKTAAQSAEEEKEKAAKQKGGTEQQKAEEKKSKIAEEQTEDKKEKAERIRLQADAEAEIHSSLKGEASNQPEDRQAETKGSSGTKDQSAKAEKGRGKKAQPKSGGKKEDKEKKKEKKEKKKSAAEDKEEVSSPLKKKAEKFKYTIMKLCDKINALKEKKDEVLAFIARPEHKAAVQCAFRELKRLLKAIVPKKGNADITFGFEDPAVTGYALAGISMVYPFAAEHLEVTPNFEEKEITAKVYASGNIRLFYLVRAVVCLVIDKNVRTLYHSVREMTG